MSSCVYVCLVYLLGAAQMRIRQEPLSKKTDNLSTFSKGMGCLRSRWSRGGGAPGFSLEPGVQSTSLIPQTAGS